MNHGSGCEIFGRGSGAVTGVPGIREALRRLAILATRYERPATASAESDPAVSRAAEQQFIEKLKAEFSALPVDPVDAGTEVKA